MTTLCPHGVSHQPGEAFADGRSWWCGECFPPDRYESGFSERERAETEREDGESLWWWTCNLPTLTGVVAASDDAGALAAAEDVAQDQARDSVAQATWDLRRLEA